MILSRATFKQTKFTASQVQVAKTPLATFESNVSGLYIPEIIAYIQATQEGSGDPSPINIRPISGVSEVNTTRTGANVWGGLTMYDDFAATGAMFNTGEDSDGKFVDWRSYSDWNISLKAKENTQYTFILYGWRSTATSVGGLYGFNAKIDYTDGTNSIINIQSAGAQIPTYAILTTLANKTVKSISVLNHGGYTRVYTDKSGMFEGALTASDFVSYTGQTATTALGGTYYGGYLNVPTGLMTVTDAIVDLGSLTWTYRSGNKLFTAYKSGIKLSSDAKGTPCLCDIYEATYGDSWSGWANFPNEHISSGNNYSAGDANIAVKDLRFTDKDTFKTAMSGVYLVYELATPIEIQLTPAQIEQLLGQNNVFCSSGDVAVKYWKID